ncbi:MAG: hypothetical protein J0L84_17835 [Verrucomicrobia bacterium]|nr:hypothetical protein [Verrucomicrobiota bacterium]
MSWIPTIALFLVAWLAAYGQTQFRPVVGWLDTPVAVLPALMVYASLTHPLTTMAALAVFAGLSLDALSAGPLGISILPLFVIGFVLHLRQHLILRDQTYAQSWLGFAAGVAAPLGTWMLLGLGSQTYIAGPFLIVQILLLGLLNGAVCPAVFRTFDAIRNVFDYQPLTETSFRTDREIVRGRH